MVKKTMMAVAMCLVACGGSDDVKSYVCEGNMEIAPNTFALVGHSTYWEKDGGVNTSCFADGPGFSSSMSYFYRPQDVRASGAWCLLGNDFPDSATRGRFTMRQAPDRKTSVITYSGPDAVDKSVTVACRSPDVRPDASK